jgi:hypothetical protein
MFNGGVMGPAGVGCQGQRDPVVTRLYENLARSSHRIPDEYAGVRLDGSVI